MPNHTTDETAKSIYLNEICYNSWIHMQGAKWICKNISSSTSEPKMEEAIVAF